MTSCTEDTIFNFLEYVGETFVARIITVSVKKDVTKVQDDINSLNLIVSNTSSKLIRELYHWAGESQHTEVDTQCQEGCPFPRPGHKVTGPGTQDAPWDIESALDYLNDDDDLLGE